MMNSATAARLSQELCGRIAPILAGNDPGVQSATLADLTATWLAGHIVFDDVKTTKKLRERLLRDHIELIRQLIPVNEQMILADRPKH